MNEIHPSAIIPIVVTWLVIFLMFGLAFYFAFFAPAVEDPDEEAGSSGDSSR